MEEQQIKSKSQVKRELAELADLARELVTERIIDLADLPLPEEINDAVLLARRCKRTALKRQLKHIASKLSRIDDDIIRTTLERMRQPHLQQVEVEHQLNNWREKLMLGDNSVINDLLALYPDLDIQHLNQLVRNARKEAKLETPRKYFRQIYQYLKSLSPIDDISVDELDAG